MNERNDQNVYNNTVIPQTPVEPANDFEPVRPMYNQPVQPSEPVQYNQPNNDVQPTEVQQPMYQQPTYEQPINQVEYPSQVEQPVGSNPFPTVEPTMQPEVSYEQPVVANQAPQVNDFAQPEPVVTEQSTESAQPQVEVEPQVMAEPVVNNVVEQQPEVQPTVEPLPVESEVQPVMGGNVEEAVEQIMDKPSKKSRHDKVEEDWNEKPKKKGHGVLIVILILVILGLAAYIIYDKGILDPIISKITGTEPKTEEKNEVTEESTNEEVEENQSTQNDTAVDESTNNVIQNETEVSKLKSFAYTTDDDKYLLILNEYDRSWINPKFTSPVQTFTLSIDENQGVTNIFGNYVITGNQLELINNDNSLSILDTLGAEVVVTDAGQHRVTLIIENNTVTIGNTILNLK